MKPTPQGVLNRLRKHEEPPPPAFQELTHRIVAGASRSLEVVVRSESDWWVYNEVFVDHEYDAPLELALDAATPDARFVVVDLGANAGYFAARAVQLWHRRALGGEMSLLMVEGSPSVHADLRQRHEQHPLPGVEVNLVHGLVGNRAGSAEIAEVPFGARNTLHAEHNAGIMDVAAMVRHTVAFVDLDELVPAGQVDLLKVDIEGSELLVLEAYADTLLRRVSVAVLEFHHHLVDVVRCYELLEAAGLHPQSAPDLTATYTSVMTFTRRQP